MKSISSSPGRPRRPTRVVKRIDPTQPGALKLARQFGERLVCVRYRHDLAHTYRYTTVELIVDEGLLQARPAGKRPTIQLVAVRIPLTERELCQIVRAHGAVWDSKAKLWYLHRTTATALGLQGRIV
jgi:hypothetical protein